MSALPGRAAMLFLLLAGCIRFQVADGVDSAPDSGDTDPVVPTDPRIAWGDLHNHTNMSHDGCEDPDAQCGPDSTNPADLTFERAIQYGLDFTAITDHAEFTTYQRPDDGIELDIWEHSKTLVQAAEGTAAFGLLGYEWTSSCTDVGDGYQAMHRTVIVEEIDGCAEWRIPSCHSEGSALYGSEVYGYSLLEPAILPSDLLARLQAVPGIEGCAESRWAAFFHHVAQDRPAWVDWASADSWVEGDTVVEIASEHGSSECESQDLEGCDWRFSTEHHVAAGSIHAMLQNGHKLGFVGGTDNHQDEPGKVDGGPGRVRDLQNAQTENPWHSQFANGTLTGAISYAEDFDRGDLFDALEARHTVVASWPAERLVIYATGADGARYLPGDDVPAVANPLTLTVTLGDDAIDTWDVQIVDPFGQVGTETTFEVPAGDARYVRIRAFAGEAEHRVFGSPFFGE